MSGATTPSAIIRFNKPYVDRGVIDFIARVIDSGKLSGDGEVCKDVERRMERLFNVRHVLLTSSGTHALEMGMMILGLQPGDEVILPSFTFVSTANAILRAGGTPVFCDINQDTLTMDPADLERKISSRTRAVVPVHYAGVSASMDEIGEIARAHTLTIVEDAAQGVNARYKGKYLGTIAPIGAYSFHDTKNYVCGEGGAFLTSDEEIARQAEIIREKGTNRSRFLRGEVDKYTWIDVGSSYVLSDILAAVLQSQLEKLDEIQSRRRHFHNMYATGLRDLELQGKLRLPNIPASCDSNYHMFFVILPSEQQRNRLMAKLKEFKIETAFHYVPLHSSPFARSMLGMQQASLPITEKLSASLLRLPLYPGLVDSDVEYIVEKVRVILK
jgi:dTDP-4-amino-4,6-dideoxygalactose transaminase